MIHKVISGGQTGVDMAGLKAALICGIETGGWAPKGYKTEVGFRPTLLKTVYGLQEDDSPRYESRTRANVMLADVTLLIARPELTGGSRITAEIARKESKPCYHISALGLDDERQLMEAFSWLNFRDPRILNIAGHRESTFPGIEQAATNFLKALFRSLLTPAWR